MRSREELLRWGIEPGFHDAAGAWREPPDATLEAIAESMGAKAGPHPDDAGGVPALTVRLDHPLPPLAAGVLALEDGTEMRCEGTLPAAVPAGYHTLAPDSGSEPVSLVVSPGMAPVPAEGRWGIAAQLYAARSRDSWGIGDLADLAEVRRWCRELGGSVTLLNPLHAGPPGPHPQPSPYFASSRCFANPLYLRVEDVPGADGLAGLDRLAAAGRGLSSERRIDRDAVWALKSQALEEIFASVGESPAEAAATDRLLAERGDALAGFATFNALAEVHGLPWQDWPAELSRPGSPAVAAFAASREGRRRIRYHAWLQLQLDRQMRRCDDGELIADLAIGVDAGGADSWLWQETFSPGMRVGAPPDEFNTLGQDWGLPPWDPWRLRASRYRPFIETVRAGLRHAGGLRFDHVMGLFRLYWIPAGASAAEGTYVRYPFWDLLNILTLEASRAGAYVVGEDLGTVEDSVRAELAGRRVLSYRLLWFEPGRPPSWPTDSLGAVTTHDLPTVAGVWSGEDLEAQRRLGLSPNEEASGGLRRRLAEWTGVGDGAPAAEVVSGAYGLLADAPSRVVTVSLDDLATVSERPNMPGTVDEWPNWCLALPQPLEELKGSPLVKEVAASMARRSRPVAGSDRP